MLANISALIVDLSFFSFFFVNRVSQVQKPVRGTKAEADITVDDCESTATFRFLSLSLRSPDLLAVFFLTFRNCHGATKIVN